MKMSISIPDELWERARDVRPDLNPSHLVQEALGDWVVPRRTPGFAIERPDGAEAAFRQARDRLASQAREEFINGYQAALTLAQELDWWWIQDLARHLFDVEPWAKAIGESALASSMGTVPKEWGPEPGAFKALIRAVGSLVGSPFGDEKFSPSLPYVRGFAQAMRLLWQEVAEGVSAEGTHESIRRVEAEVELTQPSDDVSGDG